MRFSKTKKLCKIFFLPLIYVFCNFRTFAILEFFGGKKPTGSDNFTKQSRIRFQINKILHVMLFTETLGMFHNSVLKKVKLLF